MHGRGVLKPRFEVDPLDQPAGFRRALRGWFDREGRDYPWRRTRDPYAILVSEVMLQQTRIETVLGRGYYLRFLERYPNPAALAAAGDDELLKVWEGLGYYRRARMLREAARAIETDFGGRFPDAPEEIGALPGVGKYTAGAVLSFAFGKPAPLVDGNVARVLSRLMDSDGEIDRGPMMRKLWEWAEALLDRRHPRVFNSALMELGQQVCRPGEPDCLVCPVARYCRTREPSRLPRKKAVLPPTEVEEWVIFARRGGRVLLRRLGEGRRAGMWRLPERDAAEVEGAEELARRKYGITRYRVTMHVHRAGRVRGRADESWQPVERIGELAIPPADRAVIERLLGGEEIA